MVISNVSTKNDAHYSTLSADIAFRGKKVFQACFTIPKEFQSFISVDASPFLAAVLFQCMKTKENIYIDGTIAPMLLKNMNLIMSHAKKRNPMLSKVKIRSKNVAKDTAKSKNSGLFFTADVNSFYTYLQLQKEKREITHFIFIKDITLPQEEQNFISEEAIIIERVAKEENVEVITVKTNVGTCMGPRRSWEITDSAMFAATALFLRHNFNEIFIGRSKIKDDALWSTATFTLQSYGYESNKLEKVTNSISASSVAMKHLRVCSRPQKNAYNCSQCSVCNLTSLYLTCSNALDKVKTLDKTIDIHFIKNMRFDYDKKQHIEIEASLKLLIKQNREYDLQEALVYSLERSKKTGIMKQTHKLFDILHSYILKKHLLVS